MSMECRARHAAFVIVFAVAALLSGATGAAPEAELWERWAAHDPASAVEIDHAPWSRFLASYLRPGPDGVARVDYASVTVADRDRLADYIDTLAQTRITAFARTEQLAYWINLYNALTVRLVLENYPVASIRDIPGESGFFATGPWSRELVAVEGEALGLDDIEHRILRPIWRDPRIHYAVNCASIGCPDLQPVAFTAANADALLSRGAVAYVNHPRGAAIEDGRLVVSSLYDWYKEDFGGSDEGVIEHLRRYANPALGEALEGVTRIAHDRYDWSLNADGPALKAAQD
jgi:hypothetical protein